MALLHYAVGINKFNQFIVTIAPPDFDLNDQPVLKGKFTMASFFVLPRPAIRFNLALLAGLLCFSANTLAQTPLVQKMRLQNVTVFLRGAELFSSATLTLPAGESEVILTQVARNIKLPSLLISADNGVIVQSSKPQNNFLEDEPLSPKAKELKEQIEQASRQQEQWQIQKSVADEQLAILGGNRIQASAKGTTTASEVARMLDLVEKRMTSVMTLQTKIHHERRTLDQKLAKLEQQFAEEKGKNAQPGGQIVVKLYAPKATTSTIMMSYVVPDAGWSPVYDFRVSSVKEPVQLTYRALLLQESGLDWKNVQLTLSTGNPSERVQPPTLSPWSLTLNEPQVRLSAGRSEMSPAQVSRPTESATPAPPKPAVKQKALDNFVVTNADGINTSFDISLPYTIPSDGKTHVVLIKSAELAGDYLYVSVPKLDPGAFLQTQLKRWEDLNILPGKTSIYFEDSFVGEGTIDPRRRTGDTLDISLGRDNKILVRRENDLDFKKKPEFFGNRIQQKFAYQIIAKNTRNEAVKLVVFDQVPVSRNSEIAIENLQKEGATYSSETGQLIWLLDLAPHEERRLPFSYTVSYPKDKPISGL